MRFIVLHNPADEVVLVEANVAAPQLLPADDTDAVARRIRRIALEQELAALRAADGDAPVPAPISVPLDGVVEAVVGADGVKRTERHFVAQVPGPSHACPCGRAFYAPAALAEHQSACPVARETATIRGNAVPGKRVHGSIAPAFSVD